MLPFLPPDRKPSNIICTNLSAPHASKPWTLGLWARKHKP